MHFMEKNRILDSFEHFYPAKFSWLHAWISKKLDISCPSFLSVHVETLFLMASEDDILVSTHIIRPLFKPQVPFLETE